MPKFKVTKRWEDINGAEVGELFCLLNENESLIEEYQEELEYAAKILEEKNGIGFVIPDAIVSSEVSQTMSVLYNHSINQFGGILLMKLFDLNAPKEQEGVITSVMQQYIDHGYSYTLLKEPIILLKV